MHTLVEVPVGANGGTHVPAFLAKLWKIVDDPHTNDLICWSETGNSFIIKNQAKFSRDLLPLYYKHNNMASFVRQLNMYGFHKVVSVEQGGLRVDKDEMEFAHPFFLKGQEASLELIKRKIPASKHEESRMRPDSFNKVLMDVRQMKGRQETMDNKLVTMKRENEALWRELASLRQKHAKQTQIVSKLLQFLVGMMSQQTPRLSFKRRMPLMLNDKEGAKQKLARTEASTELTGPVIHDVTELLESDDSVEDVGDQEEVSDETPDNQELLFAIDPASLTQAITPAGVLSQQLQRFQNTEAKAKPKGKVKKTPAASTVTSVKQEPTTSFPVTSQFNISGAQSPSQPQLVQIPGMSVMPAQAQSGGVNVPTTLYFTAPGMSEPVQVVLSIPDQTATTTVVPSTSAASSLTAPVIPMASVSPIVETVPKQMNIQQQIPVSNAQMDNPSAVNNGMDVMSRSQSFNNPRILVRNGSVAQQDLDGHLDEMELGLSNLRDLFKNDEYQGDQGTLVGANNPSRKNLLHNFAALDPETYAQLFGESQQNINNMENQQVSQPTELPTAEFDGGNMAGQEVVAYNPSLYELAEDDSNLFDESSNMFLDDELESMLTTDRDTLKRPEPQRSYGLGPLTFSGINMHNIDPGLNTPSGNTPSLPGTSTGAGKRKRK